MRGFFSEQIDGKPGIIGINGPHGRGLFLLRKGGEFWPNSPPRNKRVRDVPPKGELMILPVVVVLKDIYEKGRDYLWPRPEVCPMCKVRRPWGHGFVLAFFDGFTVGLLLRRYRCPRCGCVIRLKPQGYFERFQASIETIRSTIGELLKKNRCPSGACRTRQAHWLIALRRKARAYFGDPFEHNLLAGL
jgi:hypothetical protein